MMTLSTPAFEDLLLPLLVREAAMAGCVSIPQLVGKWSIMSQ
jgi:hypothetical protein